MRVFGKITVAAILTIAGAITYSCAPSPTATPIHVREVDNSELTQLYFAYGSNLSYDFLKERLKNGEWLSDGWHKSGELEGPAPLDLGTYVLDGYEFGYTLDVGTETAGNIVASDGARVYGALYKVTDAQLAELDRSEDVPRDYTRVAVQVHRVALNALNKKFPQADAWVYVGSPQLITQVSRPDPEYADLLVRSATERLFPQEYIDSYLKTEVPEHLIPIHP